MNPRQLQLLDLVKARGQVRMEPVAEELGVTIQTLRRDVKLLAQAGLVMRFHGGVRLPSSTVENLGRPQRQQLHAAGKQRIAEAIAAQIPSDCSLILNIGTTTEAVARELAKGQQRLRVITNNLNVAQILGPHATMEVIVTGGVVRPRDFGLVGEAAVDFIRQFKVDIAVIGISGIEDDGTLRDYDFREVKVAQAIIAQSRQVWLAADASKFNRPAMVEVARLEQIDRLFTDAEPPAPFTELLQEANVQLDVCAASPE